MADKQISQLVAATTLNNEDLLVIQQGQVAKKLSGERLAMFVYSAAGSMIDEVNSAVEEAQAAVDELLEEKNTIAQTIADMAQLGTDTTLTTPGMAADAKVTGDRIADVEKDALAGLNQKTISDVAIASFDDGGDDAPVKELIVNIDPVQDLHGQDAPYPAGGGKNLLNVVATTSTVNGVTFTVNSDGTISTSGIASNVIYFDLGGSMDLPSDTYVLSGCQSGGNGSSFNIYVTPGYATDIGNGIEFTSAVNTVRVFVANGADMNGKTFKPMLCLASASNPRTFAPYSNICPITGWTGCEVTRRGKNLCSVNNSGEFTRIIIVDIDPIPTGNYMFSAIAHSTDTDASKCAIAFYNSASGQTVSGNRLLERSVSNERHCVSFSINDTCDRLMLYASQSYPAGADDTAEFSDIQITIDGEDWQTYEPYSGATLSVTFPDSAGTVYGGTVGLVSGVLTVDRAVYTFDGTESGWTRSASYNGSFYRNTGVFHKQISDKNICSHAEYLPSMPVGYQYGYWGLDGGGKANINVFIQQPNTTVEEFKAYLAEQYANGTPLQFVVELATPLTYQLTPQQIRTLLKINNIWANTGNINTLIYRTIPITEEVIREIMGDYEEIITGVESTGKATKDYYAGNLVIVNDILYKCLVNVASGETFTPGAGGNVSQTTIADELATLQALYDNLGNLALLSYTTA